MEEGKTSDSASAGDKNSGVCGGRFAEQARDPRARIACPNDRHI